MIVASAGLIKSDIRSDVIAVVMGTHTIGIVQHAGGQRPIEPLEIIDPGNPVTATGGGQRPADDDDVGVGGFDGVVGDLQEAHIIFRVNAVVRLPLPVEILLIPHFNRPNLTRMAVDQFG